MNATWFVACLWMLLGSGPAQVPPPLPADTRSEALVSERIDGIRREEYSFSPVPGEAGVWSAPNRAQGVRARISAEGLELFPRTADATGAGAPWRLTLRTAYLRRGETAFQLGESSLSSRGGTLTLSRSGMVEWFDNTPNGIEQSWRIEEHLPGAGLLTVELELGGGFELLPSIDGRRAALVREDVSLSYGGLRAWDAAGRELPARIVATSQLTVIEVDDWDAAYPVTIDPTLAWTAEGDQADAGFGNSVATAGDVNGDGFDDVIVGASAYDNGQMNEGRAFMYLGSASGLSVSPAWTAESDQAGAELGVSVATAGDVNDDGFSDVIVGANGYDAGEADEGRAFVYMGSAGGLASSPAWTAEGDQSDAQLGTWVGTAGDVDDDGYSDVIVGAPLYDNGETNEGRAFVYLGSATGLETSAAWTAESDQNDALFGNAVGTAGDVDGDGYDDVIVGANVYDDEETDEGRAYVFLGSSLGLENTPAWTAEGDQIGAQFGVPVATAGDVDGNGYSDVIVGARSFANGQTNEGGVFVYLGSASGLAITAAWTAEGNQNDAILGSSAATAGDVNGDGYSDVIVGAYLFNNMETDEGRVFLYLGSGSGLASSAVWKQESNQASARFGASAATAGDVNGDGYSDLVVGANLFDAGESNEGRAFLFLGVPHLVLAQKKISQTSGGFEGTLGNADAFGYALVGIGDVNGDEILDLAVGAQFDDTGGGDRGAVWILLMKADGTVDTEVKIASGSGGFTGTLVDGDTLGGALAAPGDLNGDLVPDLIVGAKQDNDDGSDCGAIWILYLDPDGTLDDTDDHQKISGLSGSFMGALDPEDNFGSAIVSLGDLDGSGLSTLALAVGAPGDDDGGAGKGAVWILFLDATETVVVDVKISMTSGTGLTGPVDGAFGHGLASLGDLDGDGPSVLGLAVGSPGDDQAGSNAGAVWVVLLTSGGTVVDDDKITEGTYGFGGDLGADDSFGQSIASLGTLDGIGAANLAVGAPYDDSAGADAGSVWILSLDTTGRVLGFEEITQGVHNFAGDLDDGDVFGGGVGPVGDFDGDGRLDLFVGASGDDDEGSSRGAAWLLQLNDGSLNLAASATWTGATDSDWTDPMNWGSGVVPTPVITAIVPDAATTLNDPVISVSGQECDSLWIRTNGTLDVSAGMDSLSVYGGATVSGPITGTGELVVAAAGTIAGNSSIAPDLKANADLTLQGGPLSLAGMLTADQNVALAPSSMLSTGGSWQVGGNLTIDGTIAVFSQIKITGALLGVSGKVDIDSAACPDIVAGQVCYGGYVVSNCGAGLIVESQSTSTFELTNGFPGPVSIDAMGTVNFLTTALVLAGDLTIKAGTLAIAVDASIDAGANEIVVNALGTLDVTGKTLAVAQPTAISTAGTVNIGSGGKLELDASTLTVAMGGKLNVDPTGELTLDGSTLVVESGGTLCLAGANASQPATVAGTASNPFALDLQTGSTLAAKNFVFRHMASSGVVIGSDVTIAAPPLDLRGGLFELPAAGGVLLDLARSSPQDFRYLTFENGSGGIANVRVPGTSSPLTMTNWSGAFGGEGDDDDPSNLLTWGPQAGVHTVLSSFTAERKPSTAANQVHLAWTTTSEVDCADFVIEAGPDDAGTFERQGEVAAAGPGSYGFEDFGVAPQLAFHYRLYERLTHGVPRMLGEVVVPAAMPPPLVGKQSPLLLNPVALNRPPLASPESVPASSPLPLQVGPGGDFATVDDALSALASSESIELELTPGVHAPFELRALRAGDVRIESLHGAVIDASRASVRIAGLSRDQSAELVGLVLRSPKGHPGLVIEDCAGVVLLQDVEVQGEGDACALELSRAQAVALQGGAIRGALVVAQGSRASLNGTDATLVRVEGASLLATCGPTIAPRVEPGSNWIASHSAPMLALGSSGLTVRADPRTSGGHWLLVSAGLGFEPNVAFGGVLLLDAGTLRILPARALERGRASWSLEPREEAVYAQALVLDALYGPSLSNVLGIAAGP